MPLPAFDPPGSGSPPSTLPPLSRRVTLVASLALALTLAAILADSRRVRTGELLVQSELNQLVFTLKQKGKLVVGPTDRRTLKLPPGLYDFELVGPTNPLRVTPSQVQVPRNGRAVVRVDDPRQSH